jgi:hypothetical protein
MGMECSINVEKRNAYSLLVGKLDEDILLGRSRSRWMDNMYKDGSQIV